MHETWLAYRSSAVALWQRPRAVLAVAILLVIVAAAATLPLTAALHGSIAASADPVFVPGAFDQPALYDLPWRELSWRQGAALSWALAGLATLLLFSLGDATLILAAAGPWPGLRAAWGYALQRSLPLLTVACGSLAVLAVCHLLCHELLDVVAEAYARRRSSELGGIVVSAIPDVAFVLLTLPGRLVADWARVSLVIGHETTGCRALLAAWKATCSSLQPWRCVVVAWVVETGLIAIAALGRSFWDPRQSFSPWWAFVVIIIFVIARLTVHTLLLGAMGRVQRRI